MRGALVAGLLAATALFGTAAHAMTDPTPGKEDQRIRSTVFDPKQILHIASTGQVPVTLAYEQGEKPLTISGIGVFSGEKDAKDGPPEDANWFAHKAGNTLILEPLRQAQPAFLFVRTQAPDGTERHYNYLLTMRDGDPTRDSDKDAYIEVDYVYPHRATPQEIAAWQARRAAQVAAWQERRTQALLQQAAAAVPQNTSTYFERDPVGCPVLAPKRVWDDGHETTLLFAPGTIIPAITHLTPDKKEAVVNTIPATTAEGVAVTAPGVYGELRLRRGDKVCAIQNRAAGTPQTPLGNGSGTVSPDVVRTVKAGS